MKIIKAVLTVIVVCAAVTLGLLTFGAQAKASYTAETAPAQEYEGTFRNVAESVKLGTVEKLLSSEEVGDASGYTLAKIHVTVENPGLLPMEWLTCDYAGASGDVTVFAVNGLPADIPARSSTEFTVELLRRNDASAYGALELNYYVAGRAIQKTVR